jgi:hypothetical protein
MKKLILLLTLVGIAFTYPALAQQKDTTILNSGKFYGVKVSSTGDVYLIQSDSNKVMVSPADFDIQQLKLKIDDNILSVQAQGMEDDNKIIIYSPSYNLIELSGATDAFSDGPIKGKILVLKTTGASDVNLELDYEILEAESSGASDLKLSGKVDTMRLNLSGASDFKGFEIKNIYAEVNASGASDVKINTDSMLIADISGASSLKYQKEPAKKDIMTRSAGDASVPRTVWVEADDHEFSVKEGDDTTKININGNEIIVIEKDGETKVMKRKVEPTKAKKKKKFKGNWAGLEFGVNGYLSDNFSLDLPAEYVYMELNYTKSTNFNLNFFQQSIPIFGHKFGMVTGMGIQWYNYRFYNTATVLSPDSSTLYGYIDKTPGRSYSKSKLTSSYLVIPILFEFQTNRHHKSNSFHIATGVIGGLRLSTHTKQVYSFDGSGKNKPKVHDEFFMQPFRLDATVRIGWGPLNLYGNYSLTPMFRNNRGPELYPFAVGIILPFS